MRQEHIVEAALFSAGKAISVEEIIEETGLTEAQVKTCIQALVKRYDAQDTVLEIRPAGRKWAMQVRVEASEPASKFAAMEINKKLLKTLALIAYHQPIKQSELCDMIGSKVYDHVPELKEHGLVKTRREGQTKILSTTPRFPEYFGLEAASPAEIRRAMAKLVGMEPPTKKKDRNLSEYKPPAEQAPEPAKTEPGSGPDSSVSEAAAETQA